jgi:hypothetical protein
VRGAALSCPHDSTPTESLAARQAGNRKARALGSVASRGTRRLANHNLQALAFAVERCTDCHLQECEQVLKAGADRAIEQFCPNTMYLRHLDAMKRHAAIAKR